MIPFVKMHGIGNDFILMKREDIPSSVKLTDLVMAACHRQFGIGADGLMVADASSIADASMVYYNSDGSLGEMCGNGIRCFARFIDDKRHPDERELSIETQSGIKKLSIITDDSNQSLVRVEMGIPEIHVLENTLAVCDQTLVYSHVTMGVPHVVIYTPQLSPELVDTLGEAIENHPIFPNRTNVNFCYIKNRQKMHVFTWERGAGHTLACGTGVTSAFAVAFRLERISDSAVVMAEGGELQMRMMVDGAVEMTGPARDICSGIFYDE